MDAGANQQVAMDFLRAIESIWMKIGFGREKGDLVAGVIGNAKDALTKTLGGNLVQFRKRHDATFLKDSTLHLTCNVMRMPAARELPTLLLKLKKHFKLAMMKDGTPVVEVTEAGANFVFRISYPPSISISFDLTATPGDLQWPQDDRIKFTPEGLLALACFRDVIVRNPTWNENIPAQLSKDILVNHAVIGQSKGAILYQIMLTLSQAVTVPGHLAALDVNIRTAIALRAQDFLDNPALLLVNLAVQPQA